MELAPGVYSIGQSRGGHVHAYLFEHADGLTLVDTLFDTDARVVLDYLQGMGRSPTDLTHIALTHAHRSHLGGLARLKQLSGATVYSHEWEADIISGERRAQPVPVLRLHPLKVVPFRIGLALGRPKHAPCPVDEPLRDDDALGPLQVVYLPGHSPGHLGFYWAERRVLVAGDAIATWPSFGAGWSNFNLNRRQHAASLKRLAGLQADVVGVGHGDPLVADVADQVHALAERTA